MHKHTSKVAFIICLLALQLCLSGCQGNTSADPSQSPAPKVTTKELTISVLNLSNVDIGMFAVIDPATGAQINVDSLAPGESVSLESNWPTDTEEFHWALYNQSGELCIDASTNISEAKTAVALLLTGEDTIENVEVLSE